MANPPISSAHTRPKNAMVDSRHRTLGKPTTCDRLKPSTAPTTRLWFFFFFVYRSRQSGPPSPPLYTRSLPQRRVLRNLLNRAQELRNRIAPSLRQPQCLYVTLPSRYFDLFVNGIRIARDDEPGYLFMTNTGERRIFCSAGLHPPHGVTNDTPDLTITRDLILNLKRNQHRQATAHR